MGVGFHTLLRGDLPDPGIEPESLMPLVLAGGCFTTRTSWVGTSTSSLQVGAS